MDMNGQHPGNLIRFSAAQPRTAGLIGSGELKSQDPAEGDKLSSKGRGGIDGQGKQEVGQNGVRGQLLVLVIHLQGAREMQLADCWARLCMLLDCCATKACLCRAAHSPQKLGCSFELVPAAAAVQRRSANLGGCSRKRVAVSATACCCPSGCSETTQSTLSGHNTQQAPFASKFSSPCA